MKLEDQVVSLELAKRLKKLGIKQESYFYYTVCNQCTEEYGSEEYSLQAGVDYGVNYSAFTVAELGEILPSQRSVEDKLDYLEILMNKVEFNNKDYHMLEVVADEIFDVADVNEANARAKMLIYLIENNLIDLKTSE